MTPPKLLLFFTLIPLLSTSAACESANFTPIIVRQCENCNFSSYMIRNISGSLNEVVLMSVPSRSYFFVLQVHHAIIPMELSYERDTTPQNSVRGTNIGLYQLTGDMSNHTFYLLTNFTTPNMVLFAITSYLETAPIPGGCNMEFNTEIAPYQKVTYDDHMITVDIQSPSTLKQTCETQKDVTLEFYHIFTEQFNTTDNLVAMSPSFNAITFFLTVNSIKKYGQLVVHPSGSPMLRRYLSNHQGHESIVVVIATYENMSSAYVPIASSGCAMQEGLKSCISPAQQREWVVMKVIAVISLLLLFIPYIDVFVPFLNLIYFGTYAVFLKAGLTYGDYIYYNISATCILACIWTCFAHKYKTTKMVLALYFAHIATSLIYNIQGFEICYTFAYFWMIYVTCVCLSILSYSIASQYIKIANRLVHFVYAIDALVGKGSFLYININVVRVASISNFYLASIFMYPENSMMINLLIASTGFYIIIKLKCRSNQQCSKSNESTPLIAS